MTRRVLVSAAVGIGLAVLAGRPADAQDLQQKVAAAKEAAAQNQQALRAYSWLEKTEISLKGEVKGTKIESCRYGPDGKVQKTPVQEPPPPEKKRGLRGKVVEKKTGEMKAEMQAAGALIHQYLPPSPDKIQAAMGAGKVTVTPGAATGVRIADYVKAGDALTLVVAPGKGMQQVAVTSYLDTPDKAVSFNVQMQSLPDGVSYPGTIILSIPSDNLEVRITNSDYKKLAP